MSIKSVMQSNHLLLCHSLLLLPLILPSISVFSKKCSRISISLFNEYSGLISFRIDRFDLLAVHGTLKTLKYSPAPQFQSISSSGLSLLYGPTLTFVHDYWKNHTFDYTDICQQSDSAF